MISPSHQRFYTSLRKFPFCTLSLFSFFSSSHGMSRGLPTDGNLPRFEGGKHSGQIKEDLWGELLKSSCSLDSAEGTEGKGERRLREKQKRGKRRRKGGEERVSAGVPFIRGKKGGGRPFFVRFFSLFFFTPFLLNPNVKEYLRIGGNLFLADSEFDTEGKKSRRSFVFPIDF